MAIVEFNHVSKYYHLGAFRTSLREALVHAGKSILAHKNGAADPQQFWALNDVNFQVEQGEALGIIGHNGAGKSTILKLLSKVTYPSQGRIRTHGRIAALIELGAGFHPDLTGRENIYLNGSILGLKKRELDASFEEIVEFAELRQFIDTPIKRYSSGMYVRLAFAVAAHVKADLLLVDEVLAVGDAAFQRKSLDKMNELRNNGATIVFISHNLWNVGTFCSRALLLHSGRIEAEGDPRSVIQTYTRQEREKMLQSGTRPQEDTGPALEMATPGMAGRVEITAVELHDDAGRPQSVYDPHERLRVRIRYTREGLAQAPWFLIRIRRADGLICCQINSMDGALADGDPSLSAAVQAAIGPLLLVPDLYTLEVIALDRVQPIILATSARIRFEVKGHLIEYDYHGIFTPNAEWSTSRVLAPVAEPVLVQGV